MRPEAGAYYRHYKGNIYEVLSIARHTETEEELVVYRDFFTPSKVWARPVPMWDEQVDTEAGCVPRFDKIIVPPGKKPVAVSAALIRDGEGRFLICQRPESKARPLLWEFVGGKSEPGETAEEALVRECREELDITVKPEDIFFRVVHVYPDITIVLTVFNAVIAEGTPTLLEHNDLKWITPSEIPLYPFCPADKDVLEKIKKEF